MEFDEQGSSLRHDARVRRGTLDQKGHSVAWSLEGFAPSRQRRHGVFRPPEDTLEQALKPLPN
jgi:hypothetical protein